MLAACNGPPSLPVWETDSYGQGSRLPKNRSWTVGTSQQLKVCAARPHDLSLLSGVYVDKGKNQLLQVVLSPLHTYCVVYTLTCMCVHAYNA